MCIRDRQYLHRELPHLNIRFIGVTDGVDTGKINNIAVRRSGKKTRQIYALVNEWYCQEISENVREILHQKVLSGEFIGSSAPSVSYTHLLRLYRQVPLVLILHLDLADCRKVVLLRFTDQNQVVRQLLLFMQLQR